jgi:hypothetical protein
MKRDRYQYHVTLTNGHNTRSRQEDAPAAAIAAGAQILEETTKGASRAVPGLEGYELTANLEGRCMVATIWARGEPVVRFAIAEAERCGAAVWRMLHNNAGTPMSTDPDRQPRAPWLAELPLPALAKHRAAGSKILELERDIAWAFLGRFQQ